MHIRERARLKVRLSLVRVYPVRLDGVGVDARADIQFVPDDDKRDVRVVRRRLKCIFPLDESVVRVPPGYIVDEHAAVGAAVERHAQRLEPLLPRRIPQLQADLRFPVGERRPFLDKIGPDSRLLRLADFFVAITVQKRRLAYARLTDQDNF